jgi:hypothetical protein
MLSKKYWLVALTVLGFFWGCATPTTKRVQVDDALVVLEAKKQREIALKTQIGYQKRLMRVSYPILEASAPLCEDDIRPTLGIVYVNKYSFQEDFHDTAVRVFGMGEALQIGQVIPGSPGDIAGLKEGDVLVKFMRESVPTGEGAAKEFFGMMMKDIKSEKPVKITVCRNDTLKEIEVIPKDICIYPVVVGRGDEVNAYADGQKVVIAKGMMRFAQKDQELALVVAHELAHNSMHHMDARAKNYLLGSLVDILAAAYGINTQGVFGRTAAMAYSKSFEAEADYVGLYIMAWTGLKIENAALFWRRMAAEHPGNIARSHAATHPATPERFVALEKTVEEIQGKIEANLPLELEYKDKKVKPPNQPAEKIDQ